jgi:transcription initiation factor TFIIE subunit alpha
MLKKFLKEVVVLIVGKNAEPISDLLINKKHVNEFLIAKKMDLTINQVRNILYKLADNRVVLSIRKKDKKKGWYTYFWKFDILRSLEFLKDTKIKRLEQIKNQIKNRESKVFYFCERCNIELNETNALFYDFTCNECGDILKIKDNSELLKKFKKNAFNFEKEISDIDSVIEKEKIKDAKIILKKKELDKSQDKKTKSKKKELNKSLDKKTKSKKKELDKSQDKKTKSKKKELNKSLDKKTKSKKKELDKGVY